MSEDQRSQVRGALAKGLLALVGIAVAIGLGTLLTVRALGLDDGDGTAGGAVGAPSSPEALPTTALPEPEAEPTSSPGTADPSEDADDEGSGELQLDVSPQEVGPGQRINMTGSYDGGDNQQLQVQRLEDGAWVDFPVAATVTAGTFQTWIQTSRTGEQQFRVLDPEGDVASNEVTVTVG